MKNNYLYQGAFSELDADMGWTDFELRNYDAQIGRWVQMDPYDQFASGYSSMGTDPITNADPTGGLTGDGILGEVVVVGVRRISHSVATVQSGLNIASKVFSYCKSLIKVGSALAGRIDAQSAGGNVGGGPPETSTEDNPKVLGEVTIRATGSKLKGGSYDGKTFPQIRTYFKQMYGSGTISQTKVKLDNNMVVTTFLQDAEDGIRFSKAIADFATLLGGTNAASSLVSLKEYKNILQALKTVVKTGKMSMTSSAVLPMLLSTALYLQAHSLEKAGEDLLNVIHNYMELYSTTINPNPPVPQGIYKISSTSVGYTAYSMVYSSRSSYYDITTGKFLGDVDVH